MAELPNRGRHCDAELCNLLDFVPVRCDACSGTFCVSHFTYEAHNCRNAYKKNVQVPTCRSLINPCPHQGVSLLMFSVKGCKKKELVPITCPSCQQNFCLGHRHEKDYNCERLKGSPVLSKAAWHHLLRRSIREEVRNQHGDCSGRQAFSIYCDYVMHGRFKNESGASLWVEPGMAGIGYGPMGMARKGETTRNVYEVVESLLRSPKL